ncbi:putative mitochondrial Choline dehydrogenase, like protein [Leptomonas pyrrhocoris]|uniref:Putative mitochondrial Choline dehydrogenase, like protein n=1 Tax=Leptomonas pyrrhocoris TaxID=157538 RepID=A0A0M9FXW4_LEPPY|nr:putative mitochondrial Choline dehydrogenase, like protein [Leptomonas pyrrhocoris]KPA78360.1 putative mitochondrial Choline dehydrogenase, like protein [Leptomonas pyrrhocoris]|eukprot:XP_015656799.1 putative mitochondrial Choline dehydrogenase, like protein [Leptomonas pyrrhocoris]
MMHRTFLRRAAAAAPDVSALKFDVIVVGSGAAGSLIAGRLGMENLKTLVIEEGEDIRRYPDWYHTLPASQLAHRVTRRGFESKETVTVPQQQPDGSGRAMVWVPTPSVLGGHGVMGSRTWNLGDERDWEGGPWSFREDLLPRVRAFENMEIFVSHRGKRGKFLICKPVNFSPYFKPFCEAASQDVPLMSEFTRKEFRIACGCGRPDTFVDQTAGLANSSLQRYLLGTMKLSRPVRVECGAKVVGIRSADGDKSTAAGVTIRRPDGQMMDVASTMVIVCAGNVGSARLLCASRGTVDVDASVGQNFWDIPQVVLQYKTKNRDSHNCYFDPMVRAVLRAELRYSTPPLSLRSSWDDLVLYWSSTGSTEPDVEIQFQPFTLSNDGTQPLPEAHGCQFIVRPIRPRSRGQVNADGSLDPKYFAEPADLAALRKGVAYVQENLVKKVPFIPIIGDLVQTRFESSGVNGGTCARAIDPETCRLKDLKNVYVCDHSILPNPLTGSTLPYTLVLADRFVDKLLKKRDVKAKVEEDPDVGATRIVY